MGISGGRWGWGVEGALTDTVASATVLAQGPLFSPLLAFLPARPAKEERGPVLGWQPTRVKWDSGGLVSLRMHRRPGLLSDQCLTRLLGSSASSSQELLVGLASRSEEWLVTRSPCQSTMQGQRLDSQSTMLV